MALFTPALAPRGRNLVNTLNTLGLTANLKLCLDAGDKASFSSGQKWLDRSGNGYDFFRGADGTAAADDPAFSGAPGGQSAREYWSFDGADYFMYDAAVETWMSNLHKNNAKFSYCGWVYLGNTDGFALVSTFANSVPGLSTGISVYVSFSHLELDVDNVGVTVLGQAFNVGLTAGVWTFVGISIDEAASTIVRGRNATFSSTGTYTYVSPAATACDRMTIFARADATNLAPNGSRLASMAMWEGASLTAAQFAAIFNATRARFGV